MNQFLRPVIVLTLLTFGMAACNSSKTYMKKGEQLTSAGLNEEAADFFLMALQKNPNNIDARIALKREGQKLMELKCEKFYKLYTAEDHVGATKQYLDALEYQSLVEPYVKLDIPPYYKDYFEESKKYFMEDRYNKASNLIDENKFDAANEYLSEIMEIDPTYKDVSELKNYSSVEPIYMDAVGAYEAGLYRKCYDLCTRVIKMSGDYKQARYYQQESLAKGRLTVAALGFEADNKAQNMANEITRKILQSGSTKKDPFLLFIDRESTDEVLKEQKLGLSGVMDEKSVVETGKLLGAKLLVRGRVVSYNVTTTPLKRTTEPGYHQTVVRKYNKASGYYYNSKEYKKTSYQKSETSRTVECHVELTMISAETGEIVLSQTYQEKVVDDLVYATYNKEIKGLYPGTYKLKSLPSAEDKIYTSPVAKQQLDKMLYEDRRELRSQKELEVDLAQKIASNWVWKIRKYNKSL